ncbi:hypothetical protein ACFSR7_24260 [Cohnella sp. GCM10020058]|uniref:hypothetical protein n=1 Tax=Cohnella sp. GCM10020058 TaxID=3317330 RepID=UPI00362AB117
MKRREGLRWFIPFLNIKAMAAIRGQGRLAIGVKALLGCLTDRKTCICTGIFCRLATLDEIHANTAGKFKAHAGNRDDGRKNLHFCIFFVQKG